MNWHEDFMAYLNKFNVEVNEEAKTLKVVNPPSSSEEINYLTALTLIGWEVKVERRNKWDGACQSFFNLGMGWKPTIGVKDTTPLYSTVEEGYYGVNFDEEGIPEREWSREYYEPQIFYRLHPVEGWQEGVLDTSDLMEVEIDFPQPNEQDKARQLRKPRSRRGFQKTLKALVGEIRVIWRKAPDKITVTVEETVGESYCKGQYCTPWDETEYVLLMEKEIPVKSLPSYVGTDFYDAGDCEGKQFFDEKEWEEFSKDLPTSHEVEDYRQIYRWYI